MGRARAVMHAHCEMLAWARVIRTYHSRLGEERLPMRKALPDIVVPRATAS